MTDIEDDVFRAIPLSAGTVRKRSLVLAAVVSRAGVEGDPDRTEARSYCEEVRAWLHSNHLDGELEPREEAIMRAPLGTLDRELAVRGAWAVEGLAVLAWALGDTEFPPHDTTVDPYDTCNVVGLLAESVRKLVQESRLRSPAELQAARELNYALHVEYVARLRGRLSGKFSRRVCLDWLTLLGLREETLLVDGELLCCASPISSAPISAIKDCVSILTERQRASIWLVEEEPTLWDTIPDV